MNGCKNNTLKVVGGQNLSNDKKINVHFQLQ